MTAPGDDVLRFGTIVIIGGGCYGSYYLKQLRRAREAGRATWDRLWVVDRDANCPAAHETDVVVEEWAPFLDRWLGAALASDGGAGDAIVPSPLMPHLVADWIRSVAARETRSVVERGPVAPVEGVPWQREGADGTRYASFATWTCPINCIEPARCPHTRGPRDWSLPRTLEAQGGGVAVPVTHRTFGVGMMDVADVLAAARAACDALARGEPAWIATSSHCHAAITSLRRAGATPLSR